jgi:hypothetical protein
VDKSTLGRTDYVRVKIAARDISKVPERARAEGAIIPYHYDFLFEREVEMGGAVDGGKVTIQREVGGETQPTPKKPRQEGPLSNQTCSCKFFLRCRMGVPRILMIGKALGLLLPSHLWIFCMSCPLGKRGFKVQYES